MTRLRDSIKTAQRAAWPAVKALLAAETTPIVIDKLARSAQVRSNIRFIVEATIEEIAKAGLLRTPVDADVIGKAVNWHESWEEDIHEEHHDPEDVELYDAVEALLAEVTGRPHA